MTAASSLLGFTLLEALEGRRDGLDLIGLASDPRPSESSRFDRWVLVPPSSDPWFPALLESLVDEFAPDLVIAGRDADLLHLADLSERRPDLGPRILCGSRRSVVVTLDKAITTIFARDHGLPWPPTVVCDPEEGIDRVNAFAATEPPPWIAKPTQGFASRGVFLLTDLAQGHYWATRPGYLIQAALGGRTDWPEALPPEAGTAWFTDVGDPHVRSVMVYVLPDGSLGPTFCSDHEVAMGFSRSSRTIDDEQAVDVAHAWAVELADIGWRGPLNFQMKVDPARGPVPFEINSRFSGSMHGRLLLGFDEMAVILGAWTGHGLPPRHGALCQGEEGEVYYRPRAWLVPATDATADIR